MLIFIVLGCVCAVSLGVGIVVWIFGDEEICVPFMGVGIICFIATLIVGLTYYADSKEVEIFNREFGTSYTTEEYFYGGDLIEGIIKGERLRINMEE